MVVAVEPHVPASAETSSNVSAMSITTAGEHNDTTDTAVYGRENTVAGLREPRAFYRGDATPATDRSSYR